MKSIILTLSFVFSTLFLTTGCSFINPYTKILEDIRNQNIEGVFTAYETAFQGINIDYIENTTTQYQRDRENDLLISGYQIVSGKTPEDIKQMQIFSISDIQEIDKVYQERTKNRIREINESFSKFDSIVNNSKLIISSIEQKIQELENQRKAAIKKATATAVVTAGAVAIIAAP